MEKGKKKQALKFGISEYKFLKLIKSYGTDYEKINTIATDTPYPERPSLLYDIFESNQQNFRLEEFEFVIKKQSESLFDILFISNTIQLKNPNSPLNSIFKSIPFIKTIIEPITLEQVVMPDIPKSKRSSFTMFRNQLLDLIKPPECISRLRNYARYYINQYLALGFLHGKVELSDSNHQGGILSPHLKGQFLSLTKKLQSNTINIDEQKLNSKYEVGFKAVLQWLGDNNPLYSEYKNLTNERIVEIFKERAEHHSMLIEVLPQPGLQRAQNQGMISVLNPALTTDFDDGSKSSLLIPVRVSDQSETLYLTLENAKV